MIVRYFSKQVEASRFKAFSCATLAVILALLTVTFMFMTQRFGYNAATDKLTTGAKNIKLHLATVVNSEIALVKKMADSPAIRRYFMHPQDAVLKQRAFEELASYEQNFEDKSLFWINDFDKMFYRSKKEPYFVDTELPENYWYNMTLYDTDTYNFNINYNPDLNEANFWINVPILSDDKNPIGMAGTSIKIDNFLKSVLIMDDEITLLMFNKFYEITVAKEKHLVLGKTLLQNHLMDIGEKIISLAESARDSDAVFFTHNDRMYCISSIPFMHWYLVCSSSIEFSALVDPMLVLVFVSFFMSCALLVVIFNIYVSRLYREVVWAKDQADMASRAKSAFLARMSHEIRTPLNAITGFCELARREHSKPAALEYIGDIKRAGASLLGIVNDILDFSKIEAGRMVISGAPYDTAALLHDVLRVARVRAAEKSHQLVTHISSSLPRTMIGDAGRIRQILLNLLVNAVKYTEEGGVVLLAVSGEKTAADAIRLTLAVEDSGIGIRPEELPKIFDDFMRLDEKRNSAIEGTGLGLPITRSLCLAMGGDLAVASEYGQGSVFTATIVQGVDEWKPMSELASLTHGPEAPMTTFSAPDAAVLLVDDFPDNLRVAEGLLRPYRMQVHCCRNGREALQLVQTRSFDCVLMDHMMPEMDGIEATSCIRALGGRFADLPVIALTANAMSGMREFFLERGFSDYLPKPVEPVLLDAVLARWIPEEKQGAAEALAQAEIPSGDRQEQGQDPGQEPGQARAPGMARAARAALAAERLDLLNHYRWHFENGLPVDAAYYEKFCALVDIMDAPPNLRGDMATLAAAGRRGDTAEIRRFLPGLYAALAAAAQERDGGAGADAGWAGEGEEALQRLKIALDAGDSQGIDAAMDALRDMDSLSPEARKLYYLLNDALLMDETEKASAHLEAYVNGMLVDEPVFEGVILVCEDNRMNRKLIRKHLERIGFHVVIAANGKEGVDKVRERAVEGGKPFDLIFMDIHMPVMDGIEAVPKMLELGASTPIVALTATTMSSERERHLALGMKDCLAKPFTSRELYRCLLKHLRPVGFANVSAEEKEKDIKLQYQLKKDFIQSDWRKDDEIAEALAADDIELAHRLAHTLTSTAGLIGRPSLRRAAADVKAALKNGENTLTEPQMAALRSELSAALRDLAPYIDETRDARPSGTTAGAYDAKKARKLIATLEPLLNSGNLGCLDLVDDLRPVPGSGELIRQIEDLCFAEAATVLAALKQEIAG